MKSTAIAPLGGQIFLKQAKIFAINTHANTQTRAHTDKEVKVAKFNRKMSIKFMAIGSSLNALRHEDSKDTEQETGSLENEGRRQDAETRENQSVTGLTAAPWAPL